MKRIFSGLLTAVLLVSLTACSDQTAEKTFLAMDTAIRLSAYGKDSAKAVAAGKENILRMEELFFIWFIAMLAFVGGLMFLFVWPVIRKDKEKNGWPWERD